jgi:hypothetical protein
MGHAFELSALLEMEAALTRAEAAGDRVLVGAVEGPLSELELLALERVPCGERREVRHEVRDLLFFARRRATNQTRPAINDAVRLANARNFGVDLLVALRGVGAACVGDVEDSLFPRCIAANCLRALMRLCVIDGGRLDSTRTEAEFLA